MIKKAVIPVAGLGTRFLPVTKSVPKEMLPIIDTPAIHYIVKECYLSGIEEIIFITSPLKPEIKNYFSKDEEYESRLSDEKKILLQELNEMIRKMKFHYIIQTNARGSGHAISLAKDIIDDDYFAVLYGDDLIDSDIPTLKQLININETNQANVIGALSVPDESVSRYGILDVTENNKIKNIIEKPSLEQAPSNLAGLGRYIVSKDIFNILDNLHTGKNGEYQFTDAMAILMKKQPFYACNMNGTYYDIGNKVEYIRANLEMGLKREDLKDKLTEIIK